MNVTICALVQLLSGLKVVAEVPLVTLSLTAQRLRLGAVNVGSDIIEEDDSIEPPGEPCERHRKVTI